MNNKVYSGPMRFAHRGVVQAAPENTQDAFQAAVDAGLEGIEIDIRRSADGEIVIVHDETLERLTAGHPVRSRVCNGRIAEMTWDQLSKIEIPYHGQLLPPVPPPSGVRSRLAEETGKRDLRMAKLMRLEDMLKWLAEQPGEMMVEIEYKAPGMIRPLLRILEASPLCSRCILFSGEPVYIDEMQTICAHEGKPEGLRLGANIRYLTEAAKAEISKMDLYEVGLNEGYVSKEDMDWLSGNGIKAFSNLGDYPGWWRSVCELGMHGIKTNYAQMLTDWWLSRYGR